MDEAPDFGLHRFTTDSLRPSERLEVWRELLSRKLLRVAMDPVPGKPFRANATLRAQHGLRMGMGRMGACISHRTREIVADDNDDMVLFVNLGGPFVIQRGAESLALGDGDACLIDCCETGAFIRPAPGKLACVRVPRSALDDQVPSLESVVGRLIPGDTDPLRLLLSYVALLLENDDMALLPEASPPVVRHIGDLVALTVGAGREAARLAESSSLRAARLRAVKTYITGHIGPFPILIENVAAHHRISSRYVRKLFEAEGRNFSTYVTHQRLARAHSLLTQPSPQVSAISSIAYEVGFGDLSYFNRAFRQRYDATPSDIRAEAAIKHRLAG